MPGNRERMSQFIIKEVKADDEKFLPFLFASTQNELAYRGQVLVALENEEICGTKGRVEAKVLRCGDR